MQAGRLALTLAALATLAATGDGDARAGEAGAGGGRARGPEVRVGLQTGVGWHFGKTNDLDAVTGATRTERTGRTNQVGSATGLFVDVGALRLGPGTLGIETAFAASAPDLYVDLGWVLRYRMHFAVAAGLLRAVEAFIGAGAWMAWAGVTRGPWVQVGPALGLDLELGDQGLLVGVGLNGNAVNPVPVAHTDGSGTRREDRLDSVLVLLRLGVRAF